MLPANGASSSTPPSSPSKVSAQTSPNGDEKEQSPDGTSKTDTPYSSPSRASSQMSPNGDDKAQSPDGTGKIATPFSPSRSSAPTSPNVNNSNSKALSDNVTSGGGPVSSPGRAASNVTTDGSPVQSQIKRSSIFTIARTQHMAHSKGDHTFVLKNYSGETNSQGNPHGYGRYEYADGSRYEGDWINSYRHGKGKCNY